MSFYSIYRIVKDIIRTIFGHRFWRKLLIVCLIAFGIWFFMHSKGYCVEETEDVNYSAYSYYESITNQAISLLGRIYIRDPNNSIFNNIKNNNLDYTPYFFYGANDGSDYLGGIPINKTNLNITFMASSFDNNPRTPTAYDYLGLTGFSIYSFTGSFTVRTIVIQNATNVITSSNPTTLYIPLFLTHYKSTNWLAFEDYVRNGSIADIVSLLEDIQQDTSDIKDALTSEDYDENDVSIGSTTIDNVTASTDGMFTTIFTNFNNAVSGGVSELEIPLPHTEETIVIPSDIVSSHLGNFAYLVQAFWMYVFGLYTWRFVNNLIHRIKDGSILDGFKSDGEVITNTML